MLTPATETRTTPQDEAGLGPAAKGVAEHASALARLEVRLALLELWRSTLSASAWQRSRPRWRQHFRPGWRC